MSALGQKQTLAHVRVMSALPPKADIAESDWHVRFVPQTEVKSQIRLAPCGRNVASSIAANRVACDDKMAWTV
jgi:hypothetical protein